MSKFLKPTFGKLNSPYGYRTHPITGARKKHEGIDISRHSDNSIFAAYDGIVTRVQTKKPKVGYGNFIIIKHDVNGIRYDTLYAHLHSVNVVEGQKVSVGDRIGIKGTTGASTGVHLHFEIHKGGFSGSFTTNFDPLRFINMNEDPTPENIKKHYTKNNLEEILMKEVQDMLHPNEPKTPAGKTHKENYKWAEDNGLIVRENASSLITAEQMASIIKRLYDKIMEDIK